MAQTFNELIFLPNKNGSKIFYELLTHFATHTEGSSDFTKIVITLVYILAFSLPLFGKKQKPNTIYIIYNWFFSRIFCTVVKQPKPLTNFESSFQTFRFSLLMSEVKGLIGKNGSAVLIK